jgi:hypothetical protein
MQFFGCEVEAAGDQRDTLRLAAQQVGSYADHNLGTIGGEGAPRTVYNHPARRGDSHQAGAHQLGTSRQLLPMEHLQIPEPRNQNRQRKPHRHQESILTRLDGATVFRANPQIAFRALLHRYLNRCFLQNCFGSEPFGKVRRITSGQ